MHIVSHHKIIPRFIPCPNAAKTLSTNTNHPHNFKSHKLNTPLNPQLQHKSKSRTLKQIAQSQELRIGLFGGSFDPIHKGHIQIALNALKTLELHQIFFIIAKQNPLKKHPAIFNIKDRSEKIAALLKKNHLNHGRRIFISNIESHLNIKFTLKTIRKIKQIHTNSTLINDPSTQLTHTITNTPFNPRSIERSPNLLNNSSLNSIQNPCNADNIRNTCTNNSYHNIHFTWIMGSDCFTNLHKWYQWKEIFQEMDVAVYSRPKSHYQIYKTRAFAALQKSNMVDIYSLQKNHTIKNIAQLQRNNKSRNNKNKIFLIQQSYNKLSSSLIRKELLNSE